MRRRLVIGAIATCAVLLSACSSGGGAPAPAAGSNARQYLLRNTDLPAGWVVDNSPRSPSRSCYDQPLTKVASQSYGHANFAQAGGLPQLAEELADFTSSEAAAAGFRAVKGTLDGCQTFTETVNTETISGTLAGVPSTGHGDQSAAYDAKLTVGGRAVNQEFVLVQQGRSLVLVALADSSPPNSGTLQGFVDQATGKLPT
jgi:hypothetical protein